MSLLLGSALLVTTLTTPATAADLTQLITVVAKYESGQNAEPLRQLEQLIRESAGKRPQRAEIESAMMNLLAPASTFEARRFACQQLAIVGSDASVPAIAKLLQDDESSGIACLAFGNRPSAKADTALRDALSAARHPGSAQIISTLGNRRDVKAVKLLTKAARDAETAVAETSIQALGKIGNRAAHKALVELQPTVSPKLVTCLAEADLCIAGQLAAAGDRKEAAKIYGLHSAPNEPVSVRRGAYCALAGLDKDGGEQRILTTLRGADETLRPVAIGLVGSLPSRSASERFARELPGLAPHEQVWLLDSLAARSDATARAAIAASISSPNALVRRAAASALSKIGDATSVRAFANAIVAATDDEIRTLISALGALPRRSETDTAILAEIKSARGETRARLISALVTRPSPEVNTALFSEVEHPDPIVARAAYRVLARTGAGEPLPLLLRKFAAIRNGDLRSEVVGFVEQAVTATDNSTQRSKAVLDALLPTRDVGACCALFQLLPACGDSAALARLTCGVADSDAAMRDAAIRALAEWPDRAAWNALVAVWSKTENDAHRSLALRGLVRLADESNARPDATLIERYGDLFAGARNDDERKLILGALGGAAHPDALKLALPLLDNSGVRAEAEAAVKKIAKAIEKQHPEAAKAALERIAK